MSEVSTRAVIGTPLDVAKLARWSVRRVQLLREAYEVLDDHPDVLAAFNTLEADLYRIAEATDDST